VVPIFGAALFLPALWRTSPRGDTADRLRCEWTHGLSPVGLLCGRLVTPIMACRGFPSLWALARSASVFSLLLPVGYWLLTYRHWAGPCAL